MSSRTYFPKSVKAVAIPKKNGGTRILGIPIVEDRVEQMVAKIYFELNVEKTFDKKVKINTKKVAKNIYKKIGVVYNYN